MAASGPTKTVATSIWGSGCRFQGLGFKEESEVARAPLG